MSSEKVGYDVNGTIKCSTMVQDLGYKGESIFGISYSILTWGGVLKGLDVNPASWMRSAGKLFANGHAATFVVDRSDKKKTSFWKSGMATNGWSFKECKLSADWAKKTSSADTYVYYTSIDDGMVEKYKKLVDELHRRKLSGYAIVWPNLPFSNTDYQNCVSHCNYLMSELGLARWKRRGWWMPSLSNWYEWFTYTSSEREWKYKYFAGANTYLPGG